MASNDNQNPATEGSDTLTGGSADDIFTGGAGGDSISGNGGNDVITGDGPAEGTWHFEAYDRDFTSAAGQAFDIENGTLIDRGYVNDFEVDDTVNSIQGTGGNPNDYGFIYTSTLNITAGGTYRFTTRSDDGSTIQLFDSSGNPVSFNNQTGGTLDYLNNDFHQGPTARWGEATLDPNETYTIQIRFWENLGGEVLEATIQGPDTGGAVQDVLDSPLIGPAPGPGFTVGGPPAAPEGDDTLSGGDGNDTIFGDGGNDSIDGGADDDSIDGGTGNDTINGGTGDDTIDGGDGDDSIRGDFDSATGSSGGTAPTPIGQWTFDNAGDPLDDSAANDNDAILQNGATHNAATGAVDLDGNDDFIEIPHDTDYDLDSATISLGFSVDSFSGRAGLVSRDSTGFDGGGHFTVWVNPDGSIDLRWQSDSASYNMSTATGLITTGTDYDLDIVFDNATSTIEIYIDGVLQASDNTIPVSLQGNSEPWVLGASQWTSSDGLADTIVDHLDGSITDFEIYDGAFTPGELTPQPPGNDVIDGGAGNDTIAGEGGDDTIDGGTGNDQIDGGDGADSIAGQQGDDTVFAGSGDDSVDGGADDDSLFGQDGNDTIQGGSGDDFIDGDDGTSGDDELFGDAGNDTLVGDGGNDLLDGGADADEIYAGADEDTLLGGSGDDTMFGQGGDDTLDGGTGDDNLYGGDGNDVFIFESGDGNDTIHDFLQSVGGSIDDGDQSNNDFVDLSAFYTTLRELKDDYADDGILNQSTGDFSDNTALGGSINFGTTPGAFDTDNFTFDTVNVPCFVRGTLIDTPRGPRPIETLRAGDAVQTQDNGVQTLRWIGSVTVPAHGKLAPIEFAAGSIGNSGTLWVSPAHRMLIEGWKAELLFGTEEVLLAAKHLVNGTSIRQRPGGSVTYLHMLFDRHELVRSDGVVSESLLPVAESLGPLGDASQAELWSLFPELFAHGTQVRACRPCIRRRDSIALQRALSATDRSRDRAA